MAGPAWLVDSKRIATKIKNASTACPSRNIKWKSNPSRACPNCQYCIDNSDVLLEWPGLPSGVKFDPTDQEIILHLLTKSDPVNFKPHPFLDEFIATVENTHGICYTHPQNLPGVKQDGSVAHFFHRAIKAYNSGTRKRRKIHGDDSSDVRWHKTGRTKPVLLDGAQKGCKKIMVLYMTLAKEGKAVKTNWVMHQYHLGTEEEEKDGEYVLSKVFYQQNQAKQGEGFEAELYEGAELVAQKVDPMTPKSVSPEPRQVEGLHPELEGIDEYTAVQVESFAHGELEATCLHDEEMKVSLDLPNQEPLNEEKTLDELTDYNDINAGEGQKWWDSESQNLLDSQQLVEGLSLCDDLLRSQSPSRDISLPNPQKPNHRPCLSDYASLGSEHLKRDLEECQTLAFDPSNIELDTPPDFRLSQLEFGSQDSFLAWGENKSAH